jgi:chromosomal replication initiator protein
MSNWDYSDFLQEALRQLKQDFHAQKKDKDFSVWLENIPYVASTEKMITLSAQSSFFRDQLFARGYVTLLQKKITKLLGQEIEIVLQISAPDLPDAPPHSQQKNTNVVPAALPKKPAEPKQKHPHLREEFTFETFIPGEGNAFPFNAALAISKNPGTNYNPLLLYGGVGLGKTHLMQAIGNAIYQNIGGKIIYLSAENFTNEFTTSVRTKTESDFSKKFRSADVFLLDDIHFLQNKLGVQEQLFYTFEALHNAKKQMVFICDRHISELKNMNDRLVTRFESGISSNILFPNYETRIAIIQKKLEKQNKTLSKEVIELIASRMETNIRDLEGCLKKLFAYEDLIQTNITLEVAEEQLQDKFRNPSPENITVENIQKLVANYYNISYSDIRGKKQNRSIAIPRHIAMYLSYKFTGYSFTEIGYEFSGKHHTTIMYAHQKIEDTLRHDVTLNSSVQNLERMIKEQKY